MDSFNPKTQTFMIAGSDGVADISISMVVIDAQRVRLANVCISYGVQLGLTIMMLIMTSLLVPLSKLRKAVHMVNLWSLIIAVIRLSLLILYFPGPLSEFYVAWTRDATALSRRDYDTNTTGNSFNVVQFALIETALILQSWGLIKSWPKFWQWFVKGTSLALAIATIAVKALWVVHHTWALHHGTIPVTLDDVGEAATVLGAVSIFYFCGIFFANLTVHMAVTRGILQRPGHGLTSLEILAIGNGILMLLPSIFAALDISAGLTGTRILPFDAGSWVMTLVVIGLPLTALIATYRGPIPKSPSQRVSLFSNSNPHHNIRFSGSLGGDTTIGSPTGNIFVTSLDTMRKGSKRSQEQDGASSDGREADLELGLQAPKEPSVNVDGDYFGAPRDQGL